MGNEMMKRTKLEVNHEELHILKINGVELSNKKYNEEKMCYEIVANIHIKRANELFKRFKARKVVVNK